MDGRRATRFDKRWSKQHLSKSDGIAQLALALARQSQQSYQNAPSNIIFCIFASNYVALYRVMSHLRLKIYKS